MTSYTSLDSMFIGSYRIRYCNSLEQFSGLYARLSINDLKRKVTRTMLVDQSHLRRKTKNDWLF